MSNGIRFDRCATFDKFGVTVTPPETLRAVADKDTISLAVGVDQLTRREYKLTRDEALRLAEWIQQNTESEGGSTWQQR